MQGSALPIFQTEASAKSELFPIDNSTDETESVVAENYQFECPRETKIYRTFWEFLDCQNSDAKIKTSKFSWKKLAAN